MSRETVVQITLESASPFIMHRFRDTDLASITSGHRTSARAGERPPPEVEAESYAYRDEHGHLCIPAQNLYKSIIEAGSFHKAGKRQLSTAKASLIPSCMLMSGDRMNLPLVGFDNKPLLTFALDARRVVNPATGGSQVCVRPLIAQWRCKFAMEIDTKTVNLELARDIVDDAGKKVGIGSMRPMRKGPYGRFTVIGWER